MSNTLLPCPFCGGEFEIITGRFVQDPAEPYQGIHMCNALGRQIFTRWCDTEKEVIELINRRAQPENKPLSLDELRQMDGEPVYIVESPDWGHWELSYDAEDYMQNRDEDFYGMTCNAVKDGWCSGTCKYGLHNMGWLAYRAKPKEVV